MEEIDIINAYYDTRSNKRRSHDSSVFEIHWERDLCRLMHELDLHTYVPSAYAFIVDRPRPREVFACEMQMRIIDHYIDERMRPLIEEELTDRTFNNRIGYGAIVAINTLISDIYEVSRGFTKDAWIIKMDLQGYFPNADQDIVYEQLSDILERKYEGEDKDFMRYLLRLSVYSSPTRNCTRKSPLSKWSGYPPDKSLFTKPDGIGGAIGRLQWQVAMNYYLNDIDHYIVDTLGLHYVRFVDDMVIVTDNKELTLTLIPEIRRMIEAKGCKLHPKKFYCQHYTKGVEFVGATIKRDRVYANNRTIKNAKQAIYRFNRKPCERYLESFLSSMNSYLGIFKGRNAYRIIKSVLEDVNPKWWKYCHLDEERLCLQANDGFTHSEILSRRYNLKFKKNDNRRKNQRRRSSNAGVSARHAELGRSLSKVPEIRTGLCARISTRSC